MSDDGIDEKPYWEWILGRRVEKTGGERAHALTQVQAGSVLQHWAKDRGDVLFELDLRLRPHGEPHPRLVPDIAYMSSDRLLSLPRDEREMPTISPEIVVEILAPDDVPEHLAYKRDVYFASGAELFLQIDPLARRVEAWDAQGAQDVSSGPVFTPRRYPDLTIRFAELFAPLDRPARR